MKKTLALLLLCEVFIVLGFSSALAQATTITLTSGNGQTDTVSTSLSQPFVVTVTDDLSAPVAGVPVNFAVTGVPSGATGQGLSLTSATTNASGQASSLLTLGSKAGTYSVAATSGALQGSPVGFSASALAGPAKNLLMTSGDGQNAQVISVLSPFVVTVTDVDGNPVAGKTITFAMASWPAGASGYSLSTLSDVTDINGQASTVLTLGTKRGTYTVTATGGGLTPTSVTFAANGTPGSATQIKLELRADGNSKAITDTSLASTYSLTGYAITRDVYSNFIANVAADSFKVVNRTGGVDTLDMVVSGDHKSETFTADLIGTGRIQVWSSTLTGTSGTITVTAGTPARIKVETRADGNGKVVPDTTLVSGTSLVAYAIERDINNNFIANIPADSWSLPTKTWNVVDGDLVASSDKKSAVFTGHLIGTAVIRATSGGLTPTVSGTVTVTAGSDAKVQVETKSDGTGVIVPAQSLASGNSITVYSIVRDVAGNFKSNVAAASWSLVSKVPVTGGVLDGDLVPSSDRKSAVFTGHVIGSTSIQATYDALTPVYSGTITVIAGTAAKLRIESAANGTGTVLPAQSLASGAKDTAYAIARDASDNFVGNVAADPGSWSLINKTGSVADGDLIPSGDQKSAIFTAHATGTAQIHATYGVLPVTNSGTITVTVGTAAKIKVETRPDGTGTIVPDQTLLSSRSITVYAIARDTADNFLGNIAASAWSLQSKTGGVADSDLVVNGDRKSAIFTGHVPGAGRIQATATGLTPTMSGTITVALGTPARVRVETKADGTGTIVPSQTILASRSITVYAISRDSSNNFLANVAASNWAVLNGTEGVADSDLVASGDKKSAVFTGHSIGTGQLRAQYSTLTPYLSGTLTVAVGTAARVRVETKADGSGVIVPDQVVPSGDSIRVYAVVRDSANNFITNVAANAWSLTGITGSVVAGDLVASGDKKSAVFTGNGLGGAKIQATSGTLQVVPSGQLTVGVGTAAKLVFVQQPSTVVSQGTMTPAVTVKIVDINGNLVGSETRNVTLSLLHNTTGATLGGTTTVAASGGIATFGNLTVDKADSQYTLRATSTPLTMDTSNAFIVLPGALHGFTVLDSSGVPIPSQMAGVPFKIRITAVDAAGNTVPSFTGTVNVTANNGGILGTGGGTTVAFTNGVLAAHTVSFNNMGNFSISVRNAFDEGTSNVFAVTAGLPGQVTFVQQPTNTIAGIAINPAMTVQLQDAFGNNIFQSGVQISLELSSGTGVLTGTKTRSTNTSGLATFSNLSVDSAGIKRLRAKSGGITAAVSDSFLISPGPPSRLGFAVNPGTGAAGTPLTVQPVISLQDQFGNTVLGFADSVTVAIQNNPSLGTLGGTRTLAINTSTGHAAYTDLSIDKAGTGYTLTATGKNVSTTPGAIVSAPFNITSGTASKLAFSVQPTNTAAGAFITPAVVVRLQDQYGNLVEANDTLITVSMDSSGNLGGNVTRSTIAGLATFNDLRVDKEGTKVLKAAGNGLTGATSASFVVSPAAAAKLAFTTQPGGGVAGHLLGPQPVLTLQDAFGNTVKGTAQNVTVSLKDTATTGASLSGTRTVAVNAANGTASFTDLSIDKAGVGYTLTAVGSTVDTARGVAVSQPITIIAGSAKKLRIETLADGKGTSIASQNVSSGVPVTVYAIGRDSLGNFVSNMNADQWQLVDMTGGANPSNLVPAADRKSAVFTGTAIGSSARILATMAGLTPDTSGVLSVVQAGLPAKILVETSPNGTGTIVPSQSVSSGEFITVYAVERDAANNFVGNAQADGWSLQVLSGDIQAGDLVPSADRRSAVFTAHKMGKVRIVDSVGTLTRVPSDTIRVTPGAPASVAVGSKSPDSARVNGYFGSRLVAVVLDSSGNPVRNVLVTYSVPGSGPSSIFDDGVHTATTDSLGQAASKPLKANTVMGLFYDTARVAGISGPALFALRNLAGIPATITAVTGTPQTTEIATAFPLQLVAAVRDSFGNSVDGERVTFTAPSSGPSGTFTTGGPTSVVYSNAQGVATSAVFVANPQAGSYTVVASAGTAPSASFLLTNSAGAAGSVTASAGTPQSATAGTAFATRLKALVKDPAGNVKPDVLVHFTAPATGPSGTFPGGLTDTARTNAQGIATAPVFTADTVAGTYNVLATVDGISQGAPFALTNLAALVDTFTVEASSGGDIPQQVAQAPIAIRVTAKDHFGNVASGFTGTVNIAANNGLLSGGGKTTSFIAGVLDSHVVRTQVAGTFVLTATRTGGAETGKSNSFQVINPNPTVRSITPSNGLAGQTLIDTIRGTGFISGVTQVTFGDQITTSTISINDTTFLVRIKIDIAAALGPRDVTVFNVGAQPFTVLGGFIVGDNPKPNVVSLIPDSAAQLQSTKIVLNGTGLLLASQISFVPATGLTLDSVGFIDATKIAFRVSASSSTALGPHDVIVTNPAPGGGADTLQGGLRIVPPSGVIPPELLTPTDGSQGEPSTVTLAWKSVSGASSYDIQVATTSTFTSGIVVFDSLLTTTSQQVGPLATQTMYYWRVRSRNAVGISVWSSFWSFDNIPYPKTYNLTNNFSFPIHAEAKDYAKEDYQLVGLPGAQDGSLSTLISGTPHTDWEAYRDNGGSGAYPSYLSAFSEGDPNFTFTAGRGFWLIKKGAWTLASQVVNTAPLRPATSTVNVKLQSGWNIITNPFLDSLSWTSIKNTNSMADSEKIWAWKLEDGSIQTWYSSAYMVAYKGYYYYNDPSVLPVLDSLKFPYSLRMGKKASKIAAAPVDTNAWSVSVDLKVGKFQDKSTVLGVSSYALEGKDPSDYHKPRPFGDIPAVYFDRPEWDSYCSIFGGDIRNPLNRLGIWEFTVSTAGPKAGSAEINFRGLENVPANFGVYLVDEAGACYKDLRKDGALYKFVPAAPLAKFKVLVGTKEALDQEARKVVPQSFALEQNYPNPFNPSTTIPVSVPVAADVTLKIYNIMGQEVVTVFSGMLEPGKHRFTWEGRNSFGTPVATGVYFVRMTTVSGPSFVGKMLFVK